jgi:hypothetical protein
MIVIVAMAHMLKDNYGFTDSVNSRLEIYPAKAEGHPA